MDPGFRRGDEGEGVFFFVIPAKGRALRRNPGFLRSQTALNVIKILKCSKMSSFRPGLGRPRGTGELVLTADFHVHTLMSGHAFCSFNECAAAAAARGLTVLGLTDHGPALERAPYEGYFSMAPRVPRHFPPVRVLFGCEANILDLDGTLDLPKRTLDRLDLVLAQVHHRTPYAGRTEKDHTTALVNALKKNRIHIIPHLYRPDFPVTLEEVLPAALDRRVLIEINKSLILDAIGRADSAKARLILDRTAAIIEFLQARDEGYVLNSDAHHSLEIGVSDEELALMGRCLPLESRYIYNDRLDLLADRIPALEPQPI